MYEKCFISVLFIPELIRHAFSFLFSGTRAIMRAVIFCWHVFCLNMIQRVKPLIHPGHNSKTGLSSQLGHGRDVSEGACDSPIFFRCGDINNAYRVFICHYGSLSYSFCQCWCGLALVNEKVLMVRGTKNGDSAGRWLEGIAVKAEICRVAYLCFQLTMPLSGSHSA